MVEYGLFGGVESHGDTYVEKAMVAATFGRLCSIDVDYAAYTRAAQFTAIFLYLDDTTNPDVMSSAHWQTFHSELLRALEEGESESHAALSAWLRDLEAASGTAESPALRDFQQGFEDYCRSLSDERTMDVARSSDAEFLQLRRRTIFVEPFIDHWRVSAGIEVSTDDPEREKLLQGRALARDLIILANDLGSLARDSTSETTEMNLVLHYGNRMGSAEAGVARAVDEYNALLREFEAMIARGSEQAWFRPYVALLCRVIEGNLDTMLLLGRRYAESSIWLARLDRLPM